MDYKLELVFVPVSDVDRARDFYADQVGFTLDHDHQVSDDLRFVQLTPRGSGCSIAIGTGLGDSAAGSVQGLQLVVDDADARTTNSLGAGSRSAMSTTCRGEGSCTSPTPTATAGRSNSSSDPASRPMRNSLSS